MTTPPPSRRALVGGALAASAVAVTATADPAYAAGGKKHDGPPLLSKPDRHLVTRFSYGLTPELAKDVRKAGGGLAWFESQLKPSSVSDKEAGKVDAWWPELTYSPAKLWRRQITGMQGGWEVMANYQRRALQRRMRTNRPVLEMMTEFWENHLNVPVNGDAQFTYRAAYGDQVREHALGKFSDLLVGAITHPAMLIYLDQATSTKRAPQREPRPRAARVPHRRRGQLHRGPRQGLGPHPHRLHRRHVGDLAGALRPRGALARGRSR